MKIRSPFARVAKFIRISAVCTIGAVSVALAVASNAQGAFIPNAITGVVGSAGANSDGTSFIQEVVNGDGLTVGDPLNSATWTHDNNWQTGWQMNLPATSGTEWYTANLGSVHSDLATAVIWNCRESFARGADNVNIYYATNPTSGTTNSTTTGFSAADGWTLLGNFNINEATNSGLFNSLINLEGITAQYIGFQINSNYGDGGRVGFSEIQFTTTPEPGSVALLGMGIAGLGLAAWRRRKA